MTDLLSEWTANLINSTEVRSLFPRGGLTLSNLQLIGFEYTTGNKLRIILHHEGLPDDSPQKWRDKGFGSVELSLSIGAKSVTVNIEKEFDELPRMDVCIGNNLLRVVAKEAPESFSIDAQTFFVHLDTKPGI